MLLFAYYLLKVSLVSGLLYAYYLLALRNKKFHQYNRFYLLLTVLLSLIIPLLKIQFWTETVQQEMPAIRLLKVVAMRDVVVEQSLASAFTSWLVNNVFLVAFSLVSVTFFALLIGGIIRIIILIRSNPNKSWNNVYFIFSEAKGTPFSFFKYIFWNKNIDLQTEEGKQILEHELTHVQEKHSADKLFLHIALIIGWPNSFFWIIRKELNMIHEFIADEKAISNGDVSTFSAMLLKTVYPQHAFTTLANPFFHSPIKRRLIMFTISKRPSYSYLRRLMSLPILSFVIVFFSFKIKEKTLPLKTMSGETSAAKFKKTLINRKNENIRSESLIDEIETKLLEPTTKNSDTIEAKFPGGNMEWKRFLETNLNANVAANDRAPNGNYPVKLEFTVTETGEIKDILAAKIPDHCPSCSVEAVRAIKTGPKWDPMTIDGRKVASKQFQFITFQVAGS